MRKFILVGFLLVALIHLHASNLSVSDGRGVLSGDDYLLDPSSGRIYFNAFSLSFGDISTSGMVGTFSNPHGYDFSLRPSVSKGRDEDGRNGFVLDFGNFGLLFSTDERKILGISLSTDYFDAAFMAAYSNHAQRGFHDDPGRTTGFDTYYLGVESSWNILRIAGLVSYADEIGTRGVVSGGLSYGGYSVSASYGTLIALYDNSSERGFGISGMIEEDWYEFIFSFYYGLPPVFSEDYLRQDAYMRSALRIGNVLLYAEMESSFSKRGRRRHDERFYVVWNDFTAGYDTKDGFFAFMTLEHMEIGYENGNAFVEFMIRFHGENFSSCVEISTRKSIDVSLRISF